MMRYRNLSEPYLAKTQNGYMVCAHLNGTKTIILERTVDDEIAAYEALKFVRQQIWEPDG